MLKIVVFGVGYGGRVFADYLEEEIKVFEVIREIDWGVKFSGMSKRKVRDLVEARIRRYVEKVDLIILASYTVSEIALEYLREKYPGQKFLGFLPRLGEKLGVNEMRSEFEHELREYRAQLSLKRRILFELDGAGWAEAARCFGRLIRNGKRESVVVLASEVVRKSKVYKEDVRKMAREYCVLEPRCEEIMRRIEDESDISKNFIAKDYEDRNVKAVVIYGTTFMQVKTALQQEYGWKVKIYDDFQRSVRDVCKILNMRKAERGVR